MSHQAKIIIGQDHLTLKNHFYIELFSAFKTKSLNRFFLILLSERDFFENLINTKNVIDSF